MGVIKTKPILHSPRMNEAKLAELCHKMIIKGKAKLRPSRNTIKNCEYIFITYVVDTDSLQSAPC